MSAAGEVPMQKRMTARPRLWERKIDLLMRPICANAKFAARQRSCGWRPSAYGAIRTSCHPCQRPASISRHCLATDGHNFLLTADYSITDYFPARCLYGQAPSNPVKPVSLKIALARNKAQQSGNAILTRHVRNAGQTQSNPVKPFSATLFQQAPTNHRLSPPVSATTS